LGGGKELGVVIPVTLRYVGLYLTYASHPSESSVPYWTHEMFTEKLELGNDVIVAGCI